jgi:hypothetical protein
MGIDIDQVIKSLEENGDARESFNAALQGTEKVASAEYETETPETPEDSDMAKIAEADAQGRIMARAFFDEMNKIAVAPVSEYPADPGAIPANPGVEVGRGELAQRNMQGQSAALNLIAQMTAAGKVGAGEVATPGMVQPLPKADPSEGSQPLAADLARAQERAAFEGTEKTGALKITQALYNRYFGEE